MLIWIGFGIYLSFLLALAVIDYKTLQLPDVLTFSFLCSGLFLNALGVFVHLSAAIFGASFAYGSFYLLDQLYFWIRQRHGLGRGDAKLLAGLGAWLGWQVLPMLVLLAALLGLIFASLSWCRRGAFAEENFLHKAFPFAPMLSIGGIVLMLMLILTKKHT